MTTKKKKILIILKDKGGCTYHRLILPYQLMNKLTEDIHVDFDLPQTIKSTEELLTYLSDYDFIIFSRYIKPEFIDLVHQHLPQIKIVMDIDDYWELDTNHIQYEQMRNCKAAEETKKLLKKADIVTTTTQLLAEKIKPFNKNVYVFPNALNNEGQFKCKERTQSERIRIGIIGGITHYTDIDLLNGVVNALPQRVKDKVQLVLCGFDKGYLFFSDGNKKLMPWKSNKWNHLEEILTDKYRTISEEHKDFLMQYTYGYDGEYNDEAYKRRWAKDVEHYAEFYDDVDVLLAPLNDTEFNRGKSELKLIEASVKNKSAIVSDVFPYKICGINAIEKGGTINPNGNCIMVENRKGAKAWVKAITRIVEDKELREMIANNLKKLTDNDGNYNLTNITKKRIKFFTEYEKGI